MLNHDTLRAQTQDVLSRLGVELPRRRPGGRGAR